MAIQFVGSTSGTNTSNGTITLSLTSLSGGISSTAATDDLVVIIHGAASSSNLNLSMSTSGYTEIADVYGNSTYDANLAVAYKKMGATPDTSAVVNATGTASGNAAIAYVWRGVNTTTPIDVTTTTASGTNNYLPNAPSITPTTSGAVIIAAGAGASSSTYTTPSGMSNGVSVVASATYTIAIGAASYAWSSGGYDPAAWTGGSAYKLASMDSWAAASIALRPDSGLSVSVFDTVAISEFSEYFIENRTVSVSDTISISESKTAAKNEFAILFHDTFTGTDGTLITAHTPEIGTGWTQIITIGDGGLIIDVNTLYCEGSLNDGGLATAEIGYAYPSADYEVECIDVGSSTASDEPGTIAVRVQDANNMYTLEWTQGFFGIYKRVSGTWSQLNTGTVYPAPGDTVTLRIDGSSINGFINGTERVSATDTSITAAGEAGAGIGAVRLTDGDVGDAYISELKVRLISLPCSLIDSISVLESVLVEVTTGGTGLTVSVFDTRTINEDIQTAGSSTTLVFDVVAIAENIQTAGSLTVLVFDTVAIAENIQTAGSSTVSVFDAVAITENIQTTGQVPISVFDAITIAENIQASGISTVSIFDAVTIVENVQTAGMTTALVFDAITITENIQTAGSTTASVFSQITITEGITAFASSAAGISALVSDQVIISDVVAIDVPCYTSVFDSVSCVDVSTPVATIGIIAADQVGIAPNIAAVIQPLHIFVYETIAITDVPSLFVVSDGAIVAVDVISIQEEVVLLVPVLYVSVFDTRTIGEDIQTLVLASISVVDVVAIAENIQTSSVFLVSVFDAVATAENVQTDGLVTVSVFDVRTIGEDVQTTNSTAISVFDIRTISEAVQTANSAIISVFDTGTISETVQVVSSAAISVFDTSAIGENIQTAGSVAISVFDTRTIGEEMQLQTNSQINVFDGVGIQEDVSARLTALAGTHDTIAVQESASGSVSCSINVSDLVVTEDAPLVGAGANVISIVDIISIEDVVSVGAIQVALIVYDDILLFEDVVTADVRFISVYDQITIIAILAAFPDTVHISESVTVLVEDSGVTIGTLVFDGILLEDAVSIFSVFPIVVWDNVEVVAVLAAFPDTVHITESVFVFVEDTGVSIGGTVIDQVTIEDLILDILAVIDLDIYGQVLIDDVHEVVIENLVVEVWEDIWMYDMSPAMSGVTWYAEIYSEVTIEDHIDPYIPFLLVDVADDIPVFSIAGAKSALTIQGGDDIAVAAVAIVVSIYDLSVFDTVDATDGGVEVGFNLITYFVYDLISVRERTVVYTRDAAFANLTPPEYRGRGTHGIGYGKKFSGMGEVVMAGSATRNTEQRWGAPGVGTRDRYTGTAIST